MHHHLKQLFTFFLNHIIMSKIEALLHQLAHAAQSMVQGGLSETTRQCGKPTCACRSDPSRRHGPHLYLTFRQDGKSHATYIAPEHAVEVRQAHAAWARFWEIGCALADLNRTQMQAQWQQPARTGATSPTKRKVRS
jgi:hypothetical protein